MSAPSKRILRVDPRRPAAAALDRAVAALRRGGLVIVPTETVYGLAAAADDAAAQARLFAAKGRPRGKPVALLAAGPAELARFGAVLGPAARRLAARHWPGPLTLVLPAPAGWLGFRVPAHPVMQALLRRWGGVLAVTSANRSGGAPARTAPAALKALAPHVALALDAGPAAGGVPSTVVRADGARMEVLRAGAIPAEALGLRRRRAAPPARATAKAGRKSGR